MNLDYPKLITTLILKKAKQMIILSSNTSK